MKFDLPERGPSEESATEKQIEYIKHLAPNIKEREVRQLGKWQASSLIDELQDVGDSGRRGRRDGGGSKKGCGCVGPILLLVAICTVAAAIGQCGGSTSEQEEKGTQTLGEAKDQRSRPEDSVESKPLPKAPEVSELEDPVKSKPLPQAPRVRTAQRTWIDAKGRELQAALIRLFKMDGIYHGDFERPDGSVFTYKIGNLSEDDVELVKGLLKEAGSK